MSVRPTRAGVNVVVRYITRANERQEVRARLYRAVVDLLRNETVARARGAGRARAVGWPIAPSSGILEDRERCGS